MSVEIPILELSPMYVGLPVLPGPPGPPGVPGCGEGLLFG